MKYKAFCLVPFVLACQSQANVRASDIPGSERDITFAVFNVGSVISDLDGDGLQDDATSILHIAASSRADLCEALAFGPIDSLGPVDEFSLRISKFELDAAPSLFSSGEFILESSSALFQPRLDTTNGGRFFFGGEADGGAVTIEELGDSLTLSGSDFMTRFKDSASDDDEAIFEDVDGADVNLPKVRFSFRSIPRCEAFSL